MVMARRSAHLTTPFLGKLEEAVNQYFVIGAQWLSGRVFDSIPSGRGFEPYRRHCVVPLSKTLHNLLMGRNESNQTSTSCAYFRLKLTATSLE